MLNLVTFTFKLHSNSVLWIGNDSTVNRQLPKWQGFRRYPSYWRFFNLPVKFLCWLSGGISTGSSGPLVPYGLPCVRELLRFLVSLTNSVDGHNTDVMIQMGLSLLTVALESGADHIALFKSLLTLVRDDMCRNLFFVSSSSLCITFLLWVCWRRCIITCVSCLVYKTLNYDHQCSL